MRIREFRTFEAVEQTYDADHLDLMLTDGYVTLPTRLPF
jgi:hypothetical protein